MQEDNGQAKNSGVYLGIVSALFFPLLFLVFGLLFVCFSLLFPRLVRFEMFTPVTITIVTIVPVLFIPDCPELFVVVTTQALGELLVIHCPPRSIIICSPVPGVIVKDIIVVVYPIEIIGGANRHIKPEGRWHDEVRVTGEDNPWPRYAESRRCQRECHHDDCQKCPIIPFHNHLLFRRNKKVPVTIFKAGIRRNRHMIRGKVTSTMCADFSQLPPSSSWLGLR